MNAKLGRIFRVLSNTLRQQFFLNRIYYNVSLIIMLLSLYRKMVKAFLFVGHFIIVNEIYSEIDPKEVDSNAGASAMRSKKRVLSGILQACLSRSFIN